ncbi:hypothetical protein BDY24DRAFT_377738 [Mrakia frigida]|uniref:uncharacterized protein n=1 Tax=Mrakia frigida TaxID=29902 RepID=UPI003FCBFA4C
MLLDRSTVDDLRLLVLFVGVDVFLVDFSGLSDSSVVGVKVGGGGSKGVVVSGSVPDVNVTFVVLEVGESGGVTEEGSEGEPSEPREGKKSSRLRAISSTDVASIVRSVAPSTVAQEEGELVGCISGGGKPHDPKHRKNTKLELELSKSETRSDVRKNEDERNDEDEGEDRKEDDEGENPADD